jgi:hypothetical protein
MRAVRLALAVALLGATAVGGLSVSAAPVICGPGGTTEDVGGGWLALRPAFNRGGSAVTLASAPAFDPNLLWATNGTLLVRSEDSGCSWDGPWSTTALSGTLSGQAQITALHAPSSANNSNFLYLGVTRAVGVDQLGLTSPAVVVSQDRGKTFTVSGIEQGLPLLGSVTAVVANAQVAQLAYAVVDEPGIGGQVYATTDAGATWTKRSGAAASADLQDLAVHPTTGTELYALRDGKQVTSFNGGESFTATGDADAYSALSVAPGGGGVQLLAPLVGEEAVDLSIDRGNTWDRISIPVAATSAAALPVTSRRFAVADADHVWLLGNGAQVERTPTGKAPRLLGASAPTSVGFNLTGVRDGALLLLTLGPNNQPIAPVDGKPVTILPRGPITQFPATLSPQGLHLRLPAGTARQVPYELLLPRTPAPVDLMFLLDSTGSMASIFEALRDGVATITRTLDSAGLDSQFGLGDFRDYPDPYGPANRGDWPYRLDRRIGPADASFAAAVNAVQPGGGTSDGGSSPLPALVQSTSGRGDRLGDRVFVEPGQDAGYRDAALKIAVVAYDTKEHHGGQNLGGRIEPGPDFETTSAVLRQYGVHAMGLSIGERPLFGLRRIAEGSRTFAPEGGVDCNGDGRIDVRAGKPLVCLIPAGLAPVGVAVSSGSVGVAPAVVNLAAGIPDTRPVTLAVTGGGSSVRLVTPATTRVNLRADNELDYSLLVRCPRGPESRRTVTLSAATPVRALASTTLTLTCEGVDPIAPIAPPIAAVAAAAAPAAPGQPVPNANPNPNPNVNPNTAPNVNTNPGMADQQETQAQLAMAESDQGPAEQFEMSAAFVGTAGLMLCVATTIVWRRQVQEQQA